jgi:hypothetical protein
MSAPTRDALGEQAKARDEMGDKTPYHNEAIIAHPQEPRLLLLTDPDGWALPSFDGTEPPAITLAIRERLGVETVVMRRVYDRARLEPEAREQVYALELRTPDWTPPADARWVGRNELITLSLANPARRPVLDAWLAETEGKTISPQRAPWERPGWFVEAGATC